MPLYPWELTVEEWIGPRWVAQSRRTPPPDLPKPPKPPERPVGQEEQFEGLCVVWAPSPETFFVLLDAQGNTVGQVGWNTAMLKNAHRRKGLVRRLLAEYWRRYGKSELVYLWQATRGELTASGRYLNVTSHALTVKLRQEAGFEVPKRVLKSVTQRIGMRRELVVSEAFHGRLIAAVAEDYTRQGFQLLEWFEKNVRIE